MMIDLIEKEKFWEQYSIPYKFSVGVKPVRSGYSENSCGNGCNSATVYHVILDEDISIGKLSRKKDQFLCSQPTWIAYSDIQNEEDDLPVVTCKDCLKKIEKYKKESSE